MISYLRKSNESIVVFVDINEKTQQKISSRIMKQKYYLLSVLLVFTWLNIIGQDPYNYPYANDAYCDSRDCIAGGTPCVDTDVWGFYTRQGTSYMTHIMNDYLNTPYSPNQPVSYYNFVNNLTGSITLSDSENWPCRIAEYAQTQSGWVVNGQPQVDCIAFWEGDPHGHLGWVDQVNADCSVNVHTYNFDCDNIAVYTYVENVRAEAYIHAPANNTTPSNTHWVDYSWYTSIDGETFPQYGIIDDIFQIRNNGLTDLSGATIRIRIQNGGTNIVLHTETIDYFPPCTSYFVEYFSENIDGAPVGAYDYIVEYVPLNGVPEVIGVPCTTPEINIEENLLYDTDIPELISPGSDDEPDMVFINTINPTFRFRGVSVGDTYTVYIKDYDTQATIYTEAGLTHSPPVFNIPINTLEFGKKYLWYLEAMLQDGSVTQSNTLYFETLPAFEPDCAFTDVDPILDSEVYTAAQYLCENFIVLPEPYSYENPLGVDPEGSLLRKDLCAYTGASLFGNGLAFPTNLYTDKYPVPFFDLTRTYSYTRCARLLTYLVYDDDGDGATPFQGTFYNFRPYEEVTQFEMLRAVLEAFHVNVNGSQLTDYTTAAFTNDLLLVSDTWWDTNTAETTPARRSELFLLLYRCMTHPVYPNEVFSLIQDTDSYYPPSHYNYANMLEQPGLSDGNFSHYDEVSFGIPNRTMPITFAHYYESEATILPDEYYSCNPFGEKGWNHNFCSYIKEVDGWTADGYIINDHYLIYFPGELYPHIWEDAGSSLLPDFNNATMGLNYEVEASGQNEIVINTLDKTELTFTRFVSASDTWWLTSIENFNGVSIDLDYVLSNGEYVLNKVISSAWTSHWYLEFVYDGDNHIEEVRGPDEAVGQQRSVYFTYDQGGRLESFKNLPFTQGGPDIITEYSYGTTPRDRLLLTSIQLPRGNTIDNNYQKRKLTQSSYTQSGVPNQEIEVQQTFAELTGEFNATVETQTGVQYEINRNSGGYATETTSYLSDGTANTTTFEYGNANYPGVVTKATSFGVEVEAEYNSKGFLLSRKIPDADIHHKWTYTSDYFPETYERYNNGEWQTMRFYYDQGSYGNLIKVKDFEGHESEIQYNGYGQPRRLTTATDIESEISYTPRGLPEKLVDALDNEWVSDYDNLGRNISVITPENDETEIEYYYNDLPYRVNDPMGNYLQYEFDENKNMDKFRNARGDWTTMTYNDQDLLVKLEYGSSTWEYEWDDDGRPEEITDGIGNVFGQEYYSNGLIEEDGYLKYEYDQRDRPEDISLLNDSSNKIEFREYDDIDRLEEYRMHYPNIAGGGFFDIKYEYDQNSNVTKIIFPDNSKYINYYYDKNDRLIEVRDWMNRKFEFTYRPDGLLETVKYPNDTEKRHIYDDAGRLETLTWVKMPSEQIIASYELTLNGRGYITNQLVTQPLAPPVGINKRYEFGTHTAANRITTKEVFQPGQPNQTYTFTYNDNGETITTDKFSNLTWTENKQLSSATSTNGSFNADYHYSPTGDLVAAERNNVWTKYWVDIAGSGNIIGETDANGNAKYYYIHGIGLLGRVDAQTGEIRYYHDDFRHNVVAMTDDDQNITHAYAYWGYNKVAASFEEDFNQYKGMGAMGVMEETPDLLYVRARFFDVDNQRFISEDPMWSQNLYSFALNNPLARLDYDGMAPKWLHTALDVAGMVPFIGEIADGANALLYLAEGDYTNAALCAAAMIPGAGNAVTAAKIAAGGVAAAGVAYKAAKNIAKKNAASITNEQLVKKAFKHADNAVAGKGGVVGTAKHKHAEKYINNFQAKHGNRGLQTEKYFNNGSGNKGFLDVIDAKNNVIYDYKFGNAKMSKKQRQKYTRNFPGHTIEIINRFSM